MTDFDFKDIVQPPEGESPTLTRLRERTVRGLNLSTLPRLDWLVDGLLPTPALTFMYGPPKSGKSFAAVDLACSVATGRPWCGKPTRQGTVLYIIGEGQHGMIARQEAWADYHGATADLERVVWHPGRLNLMELDTATAVADFAAEIGAGLVVVDTLARCTGGVDDSSGAEMGQFVERCDMIRDRSGATLLVVHHMGKDKSKGMRGSTVLLGSADAALEVSGGGGRSRLEVTEAKDFEEGFTINFGMEQVGASLVLVEGAGSADVKMSTARAHDALTALTEAATDDGLASTAWMTVAEMSPSSFYRARKYLVDRGLVRNVGTERSPRYVVGAGAL